MSLSINSSSMATSITSDATLASTALVQKRSASTASDSHVDIAAIDLNDPTRIDKYLKALGAPLKMGADAQNIANALVPTMQSLMRERPDLANAHFDFESDNGSIRVTSTSMSTGDRTWLQAQLNSNASLVHAVQSFHDDAVSGYATWAEADGTPLAQSDLDAVNQQADGLTGFMALFRGLGSDAQSSLMTDGTYRATDGEKLNLAQDPSSAAGFLDFMRSVRAAANGTSHFVTSSGRTMYGVLQMNIFETNSAAMPSFFPPSDTQTLGLREKA
ncbi:hypothetical protein [Paraburkholderia humisilvae]|uniref:Uncharacterized protein n=1 Tax=Paraburkholderia humisilvae TaxID=627669 RepID=A0A6J5ESS6_9BURK|nr:hypothetical protein [Paraburkholderia humisilvae]CAB3769014.1 hypothetical protein LMG29542_06009 [Paraburkholderia humisilvae]